MSRTSREVIPTANQILELLSTPEFSRVVRGIVAAEVETAISALANLGEPEAPWKAADWCKATGKSMPTVLKMFQAGILPAYQLPAGEWFTPRPIALDWYRRFRPQLQPRLLEPDEMTKRRASVAPIEGERSA